jgi:PmbA protein
MKKLLDLAKGKYDQADVFYASSESNGVTINEGHIDKISSGMEQGYGLRIFKDNKTAFAYSNNLEDHDNFINNAEIGLLGGVEGEFTLPQPTELKDVKTYSDEIEKVDNDMLVDKCSKIYEYISSKVKGEVSVSAGSGKSEVRLMNSNGIDYSKKGSGSSIYANITFPGGAAGLSTSTRSFGIPELSQEKMDELIEYYNKAEKVVKPEGGKMQVLFASSAVYTLMWRLKANAAATSVYNGSSKLKDKVGEKVFSEKLSVYDDPFYDEIPGAFNFDGDGLPAKRLDLVENGVFKSFYGNLDYCQKIDIEPTASAERDSWMSRPMSSLSRLMIAPGDKTFAEMVKSMKRGIIIEGVLGAHSGNIINGDYSVGVCPGIYVENGEIVGQVKDTMIAGNIFEDLNKINCLENELHNSYMGYFPAILLDDISVAIKQ